MRKWNAKERALCALLAAPFAAVCVVGLLSGRPIAEIVDAASRRASFVCSQEGGTPPIPPEAAAPFDDV